MYKIYIISIIEKFYNDISNVNYIYFPIFSFIINTDLRAGKVLTLTWDDLIDHKDGTFAICVDENLSLSAVRDENLELTRERKIKLENQKTDAGFTEILLNKKAIRTIAQIKEAKTL